MNSPVAGDFARETARDVVAGADLVPPPPGACLAIATTQGDRIATAGHRQSFDAAGPLRTPLPMTERTSHDLGSVTKVVGTTAALMRLVDTGRISVDLPAGRFLARVPDGFGDTVTIADLLRHRAGLWEWWPTYLGDNSPDGAIDTVTRLPLRYAPDSGRHYSDLGFMLLGRIVETVTGAPLPEAVRDLVLDPLGLATARYGGPVVAPGDRVRGGSVVASGDRVRGGSVVASGDRVRGAPAGDDEGGGYAGGRVDVAASSSGDAIERRMVETGRPYPVNVASRGFAWRTRVLVGEVNDGNAYHAFGGAAGHAGLFAQMDDLLRFGRAVVDSLAGAGPFHPATVRAFLAPGPDPEQAFGFRLWPTTVGDCRAVAYGHTGFPGTAFAVLPGHGATVALLTNRLHVRGEPARLDTAWPAILHRFHQDLHADAYDPAGGAALTADTEPTGRREHPCG